MSEAQSLPFLQETTKIVSAQIAGTPIPAEKLPGLIREVHATLTSLLSPAARQGEPQPHAQQPHAQQPHAQQPHAQQPHAQQQPAVPLQKSVFPDYIVCLEDGKQLKMLKRHLMTSYNMTPDQYRIKWGLPHSYPMVAPNYAEARSALAKKSGLGQSRSRGEASRRMYSRAEPNRRDRAEEAEGPRVQVIQEGVSGKRKPGRPARVA